MKEMHGIKVGNFFKFFVSIMVIFASLCNYGICEDGCKLISGKQELKMDVNPNVAYNVPLMIAQNAIEVAEAIFLECPETEISWFFYRAYA